MARHTTTPKYTIERKALCWLQSAPRTSVQLAALVGVTPNHGAALCRRLWVQGKAQRTGTRRAYRYEVAHG